MKYENISEKQVESMSQIFKTIADPTRLSILFLLKSRPMMVKDIGETLDIEQSALSHQLAKLKKARLVKFKRQGKSNIYELDDSHVFDILDQMLTHSQECDEN